MELHTLFVTCKVYCVDYTQISNQIKVNERLTLLLVWACRVLLAQRVIELVVNWRVSVHLHFLLTGTAGGSLWLLGVFIIPLGEPEREPENECCFSSFFKPGSGDLTLLGDLCIGKRFNFGSEAGRSGFLEPFCSP